MALIKYDVRGVSPFNPHEQHTLLPAELSDEAAAAPVQR